MVEIRIRTTTGGYMVERIDAAGASTFYVVTTAGQLQALAANILPAPAPLPTAPIP